MLGECLVICASFTASDRAALEAERYLHPHPKVQRKLEAVYLKSLELPHHLICRICQISKPTLVRYLRAFEQEGLNGLKQLGYEGRPNRLQPHAASLAQHFRQNPPATCAQAQAVIAAQTGVRRGLTQVRAFLRRLKMKYRKTGFVPGMADTLGKQAEQASFLRKPSTQAGRSASGPAGGTFLRCRALGLRRVPGFVVVFCTGVYTLAVRPAGFQNWPVRLTRVWS
jgi:transposase